MAASPVSTAAMRTISLPTGQPADDRFSWIKGALTFDALRQACIDPAGRAYVGAEPPRNAMPSQVISQVEITHATWALTPTIPLNPGLVAIVGARGSGKTALTDVIAAGCDAITWAAWNETRILAPLFWCGQTTHRQRQGEADLGWRQYSHTGVGRPRRK